MRPQIEVLVQLGKCIYRVHTEATEPEPRWSLYPLNTWTTRPETVTLRRSSLHCTCRRQQGKELCLHLRAVRYLAMNFALPAQNWAAAPADDLDGATPQDLADEQDLHHERHALATGRLC